MASYRPISDADENAFRRIVSEAFAPEDGPHDPDEDSNFPAVGEPRGRYDGDDLRAVCLHYDFAVDVRGSDIPAGGVSVVATPPERRREGNVQELLAASLAEYRAEGRRLALLWPFDYGFYRGLGWGEVSRRAEWTIDVDALAEAVLGDDRGSFERLDPDDWSELAPVLAGDGHAASLALRRTEAWWRERTLDRWDSTPFVSGWRDDDGDLRAYVAYDVEESDDGRTLAVRDHAAESRRARRQILRFLANHDSQVDAVELEAPAGTAAGDSAAGFDYREALADPRAAEVTVRSGAMGRIVDVAADLPALAGDDLPAPEVDPFDLVVTDPIAPWNDGRFRVTADDGVAVESVDGGGDRPAVDCGVAALSRAVVGARSAERLAVAADVDGDDEAVAALAALFPPRRTWVREGF